MPYPGIYNNQPSACGRAFATENGYCNPSLRNIFKELKSDLGIEYNDYSLQSWVDQGVFLLNTALTVQHSEPGSHIDVWIEFTEGIIKALSSNYDDIVWVLLGRSAQNWKNDIVNGHIIEAAHPSPLAGGKFFGSKIFSKVNEIKYIKWI